MREFALIALGAALGANARYWLTSVFVARYGNSFPWATLIINVSGSFLIGLLLALPVLRPPGEAAYRLVLVTGFLGAYTTFSAFSYETLALLESRDYLAALLNSVGSVVLSFAAVVAGVALGRSLAGG